MFTNDDIIHSYTRAQAIEDGVLVDVTDMGKRAGFRVPMALTQQAWAECVEWPSDTLAGLGQSESGRLWDVCWMAVCAARKVRMARTDRVEFQMLRIARGKRRETPVRLVLHLGPGDAGEPVATVMLPGED